MSKLKGCPVQITEERHSDNSNWRTKRSNYHANQTETIKPKRIAQEIIQLRPDLIITADAGASDGDRIEKIAHEGIDVIVTDHHLIPRQGVPKAALAVVNPQQESCPYDSQIAGCGVAWLLMTAVSQKLICTMEEKQKLHHMLDYVALGTVADLVSLNSVTNRYFVKKGLEFMNQKTRQCWRTVLNNKEAGVGFLGFQLGTWTIINYQITIFYNATRQS